MKNVLFISGTYIAALIGAGLASGAETVAFFARYGKYGFLGIVLCSVIFGAFLYILLTGCRRLNTYTVSEYTAAVSNRRVSGICEICIVLFLMCVYSAMVAGTGEISSYIYGKKIFIVPVIFNILCILIILLPTEKLLNLCGITGLLLGIMIALTALRIASDRSIHAFNLKDNWALSAASYGGYNILSAFGIMCPLSRFINSKKQSVAAAILSGAVIFAVLTCLWGSISIYYGKINLGTMPMLTLSGRQGTALFLIYTVILFAAIFTTAVSAAYGIYGSIIHFTSKTKTVVIIFLSALFMSAAGFGILIDIFYRVCGIAGIIIILCILKKELNFLKKSENTRKKKNYRDN